MLEIELTPTDNSTTKLYEFYNSLEPSDAEYLQVKEYRLAQIVGTAKTEIGKEFKEAQDRLAKHNKSGTFVKWIELLDISPKTVYRLINRYETVVANIENRNLIESLPLSLSYEMSSRNAPKELVAKVLNGDITTHKEFVEQKKELDGLTRKNETLQQDLFSVKEPNQEYESKITELELELQQIKQQLEIEKKKPAIEVEVIKYEAPAELVQQKQLLESQLAEFKNKEIKRIKEIEEKKKELKELADENFTYHRQLSAMKSEREKLERKIKEMQETVDELSTYKDKIDEFNDAQRLLNKHKMDLQNIRLQYEDTQKFIGYTSNIKEFINTNLNPILTTLHLPENNNVLKEDVKLICNSLENWIFAMKQTFQING